MKTIYSMWADASGDAEVPGFCLKGFSAPVGYANGPDTAPSYREVCKSSGHAETVRVD